MGIVPARDALNHKSDRGFRVYSTSMQIIDDQIDKARSRINAKQKEQLSMIASTVKGAMDDSRRTMSDDRESFAQDRATAQLRVADQIRASYCATQ